MLRIKVSALCVALLALIGTINSAPYGVSYDTIMQINNKVTRLLELKFNGRTDVTKEEGVGAVVTAFENEIKAIEDETHVRMDSIDMTAFKNEAGRQLQLAGMTDPNDVKNANTVVKMLAIKFNNRSAFNPPSQEEMMDEVLRALDREIRLLQKNKSENLHASTAASYYDMLETTTLNY